MIVLPHIQPWETKRTTNLQDQKSRSIFIADIHLSHENENFKIHLHSC